MAAGFYQRFMTSDIIHYGYGTRFILLYFNCDLRRDSTITTALHDSFLVNRKGTEQSEKLLTDLFLLERLVFGKYRFVATRGRRWLGVSLDEVTSIDELNRLLELPCVKEHGNFVLRKVDTNEKELWYNVEVEPKEEPCFLTARMFQPKESESVWTLRVNKVIPLAVPGYLVVVLAYFLHDW
ncbi:transmembrane protein, putative [Bodo saltans]|uniref:Transmembrane protein, putative n=1 Tax=Bodo saltans TaxID=75058 RepID=A0A0S4KJP9_BODSA|nr:transmembrane protein, putative [Bodo saltans]|eukprot:CUI14814.1 transmembrane protein, putative [Bodo saltans]